MTPEVGDAAFRDRDERAVYVVIGVWPSDELEVVSLAQIRDKTIRVEGLDDVHQAIASRRLISYRLPAERLTPWPSALDFPDEEEVRR